MPGSERLYLYIAIAGIGVIVLLAAILRYRSSGSGGFSFLNILKIWFEGTSDSSQPSSSSGTVSIGKGANIAAQDIVGRDKIVQITQSAEPETRRTPRLRLRLFRRDKEQKRSRRIVVDHDPSGEFAFGFALDNASRSAPAANIRMTVEISWRGTSLDAAPFFKTFHVTDGWTCSPSSITEAQPAVFHFHGPSLTCFYAHPEEWPTFNGRVAPSASGYFLIQYRISSAEPPSHAEGELTIALPEHK